MSEDEGRSDEDMVREGNEVLRGVTRQCEKEDFTPTMRYEARQHVKSRKRP